MGNRIIRPNNGVNLTSYEILQSKAISFPSSPSPLRGTGSGVTRLLGRPMYLPGWGLTRAGLQCKGQFLTWRVGAGPPAP